MSDTDPIKTAASIKQLPSADYLHACFTYDPVTGELHWKRRPREHFPTERGWRTFNATFAGQIAGTVSVYGYYSIGINGSRYYAQRIIWKLTTGEDPLNTVDHKDGNRINNRWANLRPATKLEQNYNAGRRKDNTSGGRGVHKHKGWWRARISINGVRHHLGLFETAEAAAEAYEAAAREVHGEFYLRRPK
jgi:HNH endonuclease